MHIYVDRERKEEGKTKRKDRPQVASHGLWLRVTAGVNWDHAGVAQDATGPNPRKIENGKEQEKD